jgi:hypothetical protein
MKIIERIVNAETGESVDIERELTAQEIAEREEWETKLAAQTQAETEAQTKREAALSKLTALGLTVDDFKALGF